MVARIVTNDEGSQQANVNAHATTAPTRATGLQIGTNSPQQSYDGVRDAAVERVAAQARVMGLTVETPAAAVVKPVTPPAAVVAPVIDVALVEAHNAADSAFNIAVAAARAAEAEHSAARGAASLPKPEPAKFHSAEDYAEALATWKLRARELTDAEAKLTRTRVAVDEAGKAATKTQSALWAERVAALGRDDFEDIAKTLRVSAQLNHEILQSEHGPAIVVYLAEHSDELKELLALPINKLFQAIGRLEHKVKLAAPPVKAKPAPVEEDPERFSSQQRRRALANRGTLAPKMHRTIPHADASGKFIGEGNAEWRAFRAAGGEDVADAATRQAARDARATAAATAASKLSRASDARKPVAPDASKIPHAALMVGDKWTGTSAQYRAYRQAGGK